MKSCLGCVPFFLLFWLLLGAHDLAGDVPAQEWPVLWSAQEWTTIDGRALSLKPNGPLRVICLLGVECPVSRFYASRLQQFSIEYGDRGVEFVGVYANLQDTVDDIRSLVTELGLSFPQIHDQRQTLAAALKGVRVPEVFVLDPTGRVRYRGRVDDQYSPGVKRSGVASDDLRRAIEALLNGNDPPRATTEPVGCRITFARSEVNGNATNVTFCRSIAPIFYEHCLECHRPGEIGPFDISDYDEVRGWAEMIVEVIEQNRMPPWHADPAFGKFQNARHFPAESLALIREWMDHGTPYGDVNDLPTLPAAIQGWRLSREPDLKVPMRDNPYQIPAEGSVDYQYFVVDPQLTEDRWISSAQIIPGNSSVVHHAIVFVRPPDGVEFSGIGWLTAYVPGQRATKFPPGFARKVPAGSKFVFQMHYTPNGLPQSDITRVGMTFLDADQVTHEVFTMIGINQEFEIPPGDSEHQVTDTIERLPREGLLLAIMPHMHLRGKAFELSAVLRPTTESVASTSTQETLLKVPHYDFNWQHTYELAEPLRLDSVQQLNFAATFDNSTTNPFNPDPTEYVVWGDQTWEEMAVAFLEVARPLEEVDGRTPDPRGVESSVAHQESLDQRASAKQASASQRTTTKRTIDQPVDQVSQVPTSRPVEGAVQYAANFLSRFDKNQDGVVIRDETPRVVRDYAFGAIDIDYDGQITEEELKEVFRRSRDK